MKILNSHLKVTQRLNCKCDFIHAVEIRDGHKKANKYAQKDVLSRCSFVPPKSV